MKPVKFPMVNAMIAEKQDDYITLPAFIDTKAPGVPVLCCMMLSDEEMEFINQTRSIWLTMLTFGKDLQPFLMDTRLSLKHEMCIRYKGKDIPMTEHNKKIGKPIIHCNGWRGEYKKGAIEWTKLETDGV